MNDERSASVQNDGSSDDVNYQSNNFLMKNRSSSSPESDYGDTRSLESSDSCKRKGGRRCRLKGEALLVILTISGVLIGTAVGFGVRAAEPSDTAIALIKFPGEMMMRMLKLMVIPIIVTSIVTGLANLDVKKSGKLGMHAIVYYLATTTLAAILGIVLVTAIHPGNPKQKRYVQENGEVKQVSTMDTFLDLIRNVFPDNIIAASFEVVQTNLKVDASDETDSATNLSIYDNSSDFNNASRVTVTKNLERVHNPNVLGLITFFVAFGIILSSLGEDGKPVARIFQILNTIFTKMIMGVIWYSPIGICSVIAGNVIQLGDLGEIAETIGLYMVTVIVGLAIHGLVVLPLIYFAFTRQNPFKFIFGLLQAIITAFGTSSSTGTLPVTMRCLENNLGIDKRVTHFVLPIGATMNMDGTALLEGVASVTIAQMYNVPLSFGQIVTISVTATVASIGAAAIPSAGLVTLILVLTAIGIPTEPVALLWSIDWFLDRLRTCVNVFGDCVGAGIVEHLNREHLKSVDNDEREKSRNNSRFDRIQEEETTFPHSSV